MTRIQHSPLPTLIALLPALTLALSLDAVQELFLPPSDTIRGLVEQSLATPEPPGRIAYDVVYHRTLLRRHRLDVYWPLTGPRAPEVDSAGEGGARRREVTPTSEGGAPRREADSAREVAPTSEGGAPRAASAPDAPAAPVILFYHGGSWLRGDKITIRIVHRFLDRMRREGWFVISVNYTTSALRGLGGPVVNAHRSLEWLAREAADYGFDLERVGLYGVSAGAHVALMAGSGAGTPRTRRALRRAGVAPASGGTPQTAPLPLPFRPAFIFPECSPTDLIAMREGDAFENSRTFGLFPQRRLRTLSPIEWVGPHVPPVLLFHGDADTTVHVDQSIDYARALETAGGQATLEIWPGGDHAFLNLPDEVWFEQETIALSWFRARFAEAHRE